MKAVLCRSIEPGTTLTIEDIPAPVAGAGEVRVRVKAAGLNFYDTLIIQGKYQVKPPLPFSPAGELAGVVVADAHGFRKGDRVMGFPGYGCAREEIAVPWEKLIRIPDSMPFETAAELMVAYGTSLYALKDRGNLRSGETLVVLGASGGVGQAAVEIGKAMGARVIACASSKDKLDFCRQLGADDLVNYSTADLKETLRMLTSGKGVDVVYDAIGGPHAEQALRSLGWGGRYLVIGFASGEIPKFPLNLLLVKGCATIGVFWGIHTEKEPELHRRNMEMLLGWATKGIIKPHIDAVLPLEKLEDGLAAIAGRKVRGKIVISL